MSLYLDDIPLNKARKILENALIESGLWQVLGVETIPLNENAVGRILAKPIHARISSPGYNSSAMDGFAIRSAETVGANSTNPVTIICSEKAKYVDTGDPIPYQFDTVIPIEDVESLDKSGNLSSNTRSPYAIRFRSSVVPWKNIRALGEDILLTQFLYPQGYSLKSVDLGVIAAAGYSTIEVARKPRVLIIPTGTELVPVGQLPQIGEIIEFNSLVLAGKINGWGAESTRSNIVKDDFDLIYQKVLNASSESDLILLNAGSSAGSEDYSSTVIQKAGTLLVHGIAVRPGHPVAIGLIKNGNRYVPIIGVPGFPVSAILTLDILVEGLIAKWLGRPPFEPENLNASITHKMTSPAGDDDFVRAVIAKIDDKYLATPLSRGAGVISSLSKADGYFVIPSGVQGLEAGENIQIMLTKSRREIDQTILFIGSHDLIIDELAQYLTEKNRRLISINVGSIGGLISLNRKESHIAGSHLLDPDTGEYNIIYIKKYIPKFPVRIISLAMREQGLLVKKKNPKRIMTLKDLIRDDVVFINRQKGAGTRILLDFNLSINNIASENIKGYGQEEYTHLGVAAAIISGRADCGLGIAAASLAYDLDFIPLFNERYDLIINREIADSELMDPLYKVLVDPVFRKYIAGLKGYDISEMGNIIEVN